MTSPAGDGPEIEFLTPTSHKPAPEVQEIESHSSGAVDSGSVWRRFGPVVFAMVAALGFTVRLGAGNDRGVPLSDQEDSSQADSPTSTSTLPSVVSEEPLVPASFVPLLSPLTNELGESKPVTGYWAVLGIDPQKAVVVDLESMESHGLANELLQTALVTDDFLITEGEGGASYLVTLAGLPSITEPEALVFGPARRLGSGSTQAFTSGSNDTFWFVPEASKGTVLQLRNYSGGEIVQEFETSEIEWRFQAGVPIGNGPLGGVYELDPGSPNSVRRVADAQLVAADRGRALVRNCEEVCRYHWLNRSNWSPLDLPAPEPESEAQLAASSGQWQIEGSGRWLVRDNGRLAMIELVTGRRLELDVGQDPAREVLISRDGRWLTYLDRSSTSELVMQRLATGDRFRTPVPDSYRLFGLVREPQVLGQGDPFRADLLATRDERLDLPGFRDRSDRPPQAEGLSVVVAEWTGRAASLNLSSNETYQLGGINQIALANEAGVVGLSPANDLTVISPDGQRRWTRQLDYFDDLAILPGPTNDRVWLGSSSPGGPGFTTELSLVDLTSMEVLESFGDRLLHWKSGGEAPLASSLDGIYRYGGDSLDLVYAGSAVVVGEGLALVWECEEDRIENGDPQGAGCGFVWRDPQTWIALDRLVPQQGVGIGGLYGSDRWLLTFTSPEASVLLETLGGRSVSFGPNWQTLFDVSDDGRWAIHKEGQTTLILTDLESRPSTTTDPIDYQDLATFRMDLNRKVSSVKFWSVPEPTTPEE